MPDLRSTLRKSGQRMTTQREAVYAALCATTEHPTAEELFFSVREAAPGISLATVYNTLEMLVARGLARKLPGERSARYDAACLPHAHARCSKCGIMTDLPQHDVTAVLQHLQVPEGFTPRTASIEVEGLCACCGAGECEAEPPASTG